MECSIDASALDPPGRDRIRDSSVAAAWPGRNRFWRMVSHFGQKLSDLVSLRTNRDLDGLSFHPARNRNRHLHSLCHFDLGDAARVRAFSHGNRKSLAPDTASLAD